MILEEYIPYNQSAFKAKVQSIANNIGVSADDLMLVMYFESGLNERIPNPDGKAYGLIQFYPGTPESLGTTMEYIKTLNNVQQLDYVEKFYQNIILYFGKPKDYLDLYLATFYPIAIGKPDDFIFQSNGQSAYAVATSNAGFDLNKDGKITKSEFRKAANNLLITRLPEPYKSQFKQRIAMTKISDYVIAGAVLIIALALIMKAINA